MRTFLQTYVSRFVTHVKSGVNGIFISYPKIEPEVVMWTSTTLSSLLWNIVRYLLSQWLDHQRFFPLFSYVCILYLHDTLEHVNCQLGRFLIWYYASISSIMTLPDIQIIYRPQSFNTRRLYCFWTGFCLVFQKKNK